MNDFEIVLLKLKGPSCHFASRVFNAHPQLQGMMVGMDVKFLTVEVNLVLPDIFNDRKRLPFRNATVTLSLVELPTTIRDDNVFPFDGLSKDIPKTS